MAIPKQPRQVMINLMYIVLTALLAMNVSAEILHAFHVINIGIENSNAAVTTKSNQVMQQFSDQLKHHETDTKPYYDKAVAAEKIVSDFVKQMEQYKTQIIQQSGGWVDLKNQKHYKSDDPQIGKWSPERGTLADDKDIEATTRIMIEKGNGDEVKKQIETTRNSLLALIDKDERSSFETQMPLHIDPPIADEEGVIKSWSQSTFDMMPTIASVTLLNKFQNDARNSELQILSHLFDAIYKNMNKVDAMQAHVIAPTNYVITGTPYKAEIMLAAYNSSENPQIILGTLNSYATKDELGNFNDTTVNPVNNGVPIEVSAGIGRYSVTPNKEGLQNYSGAIVMKGTDGRLVYYPFASTYMAASAAAVVSSDNLNVIYAAIDNPFSVSVPGFAAEDVSASISTGSFARNAPGKYTANVPINASGQTVQISVSAKMPDGSTKQIAQLPYKVKTVPPPVASVNGKSSGQITKGEMLASGKVIATLSNFYFQNVRYEITSFRCIYIPKKDYPSIAQETGGALFGNQLMDDVKKSHAGDRFIFENVIAKGPGELRYPLNIISLEIK